MSKQVVIVVGFANDADNDIIKKALKKGTGTDEVATAHPTDNPLEVVRPFIGKEMDGSHIKVVLTDKVLPETQAKYARLSKTGAEVRSGHESIDPSGCSPEDIQTWFETGALPVQEDEDDEDDFLARLLADDDDEDGDEPATPVEEAVVEPEPTPSIEPEPPVIQSGGIPLSGGRPVLPNDGSLNVGTPDKEGPVSPAPTSVVSPDFKASPVSPVESAPESPAVITPIPTPRPEPIKAKTSEPSPVEDSSDRKSLPPILGLEQRTPQPFDPEPSTPEPETIKFETPEPTPLPAPEPTRTSVVEPIAPPEEVVQESVVEPSPVVPEPVAPVIQEPEPSPVHEAIQPVQEPVLPSKPAALPKPQGPSPRELDILRQGVIGQLTEVRGALRVGQEADNPILRDIFASQEPGLREQERNLQNQLKQLDEMILQASAASPESPSVQSNVTPPPARPAKPAALPTQSIPQQSLPNPAPQPKPAPLPQHSPVEIQPLYKSAPEADVSKTYLDALSPDQRSVQVNEVEARMNLGVHTRKNVGRTKAPIIYITGSHGGTGKTTTAWTMANTAALAVKNNSDKNVYLIEVDYRNPKLQHRLGVEKNLGNVARELISLRKRGAPTSADIVDIIQRNTIVQQDSGLRVLVCPYDMRDLKMEDLKFAIKTTAQIVSSIPGYVFMDSGTHTSASMDDLDTVLANKMAHQVVVVTEEGHVGSDATRICTFLTDMQLPDPQPIEAVSLFLNKSSPEGVRRVADEAAPFAVAGYFPYMDELASRDGSSGWVGSVGQSTIMSMVNRAGNSLMSLGVPEAEGIFSNRVPSKEKRGLRGLFRKMGSR